MSNDGPQRQLEADSSFQRIVINRTPFGVCQGGNNSSYNKRGWTAQIEWEDTGSTERVLTTGHGQTITEAIERAIRK